MVELTLHCQRAHCEHTYAHQNDHSALVPHQQCPPTLRKQPVNSQEYDKEHQAPHILQSAIHHYDFDLEDAGSVALVDDERTQDQH